jgi:hypothetical protein
VGPRFQVRARTPLYFLLLNGAPIPDLDQVRADQVLPVDEPAR